MTIDQLRNEVTQHLQATTITYAQWQKNVKADKYKPKDGSTTEWGMAFLALNKITSTAQVSATATVSGKAKKR